MTDIHESEEDSVPVVSVIIIANSRKQFLLEAVRSVLSQTVDRRLFEIIVVKNFREAEVDAVLESNKVRVLHYTSEPWGASLERGLCAAQGEVVCLLDDDDTFSAHKLARVIDWFGSFPELVFLRDGITAMTGRGESLPRWSDRFFPTPRSPIDLTPSGNGSSSAGLVVLWAPGVVASAMSLRRSTLLRAINELRTVTSGFDLFLFGVALASGQRMVIDSARLTNYRVHPKSTSHGTNRQTGLSVDSAFAAKQLSASERVLRMTENTPGEQLGRVLYSLSLFRYTLLSRNVPAPTLKSFTELLKVSFSLKRSRWLDALILLGLLKMILPRNAPQIYQMLASWRLRQVAKHEATPTHP